MQDDQSRDVIAIYVGRITVWLSKKIGEMALNPTARALWKQHDRPKDGRGGMKSGRRDLNPRPLDPQSSTLNQTAPRPE